MERKIGEKFEIEGLWYAVLPERFDCAGCAFAGVPLCLGLKSVRGVCNGEKRADGTGVVFSRCEPPATEEKKENAELTKRVDRSPVIFARCEPPAPEVDVTEERLEYTATGTVIQDAPPPSEWFKGLSDAWGAEILEAARDAFVYRFWDYPNTSLALVMGVSEATVRRIRKKRLQKNKTGL